MSAPRQRPLTVSRADLIVAESDHDFRHFLHAFMVFSRRLAAVRDFFASIIGVTPPQYEMLSHLRESGNGSLAVNELAARLHCTGPFITTESSKLEAQGLVRKRRDRRDGRRVLVALTAACESRFRRLAPMQTQINDVLFASITTEEFATLREVFPKLAHDGDRALALAEALNLSAVVENPKVAGLSARG
jgi:DNA-binding MarR family transcriptional regulator